MRTIQTRAKVTGNKYRTYSRIYLYADIQLEINSKLFVTEAQDLGDADYLQF